MCYNRLTAKMLVSTKQVFTEYSILECKSIIRYFDNRVYKWDQH